MTKLTLTAHPMFLGFEQLERMIEQASKSGNGGYPPFNIEQVDDTTYRISLAVAGFSESDLEITIENNNLLVRGRQDPVNENRVFLHRGIAGRQFQKSFVLADGVEVTGAVTQDGLLHIDLVRAPQNSVVQKVEINKS